jgi:cytochrome P450
MTTLTDEDLPKNLFSRAEVVEDIHPTLRRLREMGPLLLSSEGALVTTHALCEELVADPRLVKHISFAPPWWPAPGDPASLMMESSMVRQDGPVHARLRGLVARAFTPRRIEDLRAYVVGLVDRLLEPAIASGELAVIDDLAAAVPLATINEMMGIPEEDRARVGVWCDSFSVVLDPVLSRDPAHRASASQVAIESVIYFRRLIAERIAAPRQDLISVIAAAEAEDRLSDLEVLASIGVLLVAGYETVRGTIGFGVKAMIDHPGEWRRLTQDPGLLGNAIEEMLRYETATSTGIRFTREEMTIEGQTLPPRTGVTLLYVSANRDPAVFDQPDRLDIGRANAKRHLAFARGDHFCLGASLARLQLEAVFGRLAARVRAFHPKGEIRCRPTAHPRGLLPFSVSVEPI